MTYKWMFVEWGELHSSALANVDPADIKGYVIYDNGEAIPFGSDKPNKETA